MLIYCSVNRKCWRERKKRRISSLSANEMSYKNLIKIFVRDVKITSLKTSKCIVANLILIYRRISVSVSYPGIEVGTTIFSRREEGYIEKAIKKRQNTLGTWLMTLNNPLYENDLLKVILWNIFFGTKWDGISEAPTYSGEK